MFRATRALPGLLTLSVLIATPACAGTVYSSAPYPAADRDDRVFYNRGFTEGRALGLEDARRGRSFDVKAHREWRDIDRRRIADDDARAYRRGFETGYEEGYRQFVRREEARPAPPIRPPAPDRGSYVSVAGQTGYHDGFDEGRRDASHGERFDPVRSRQYRSADHEYNRRFGSLDEYKREYRDAFQRGYEEGYRGYRR